MCQDIGFLMENQEMEFGNKIKHLVTTMTENAIPIYLIQDVIYYEF